jgi:hypothetical protein
MRSKKDQFITATDGMECILEVDAFHLTVTAQDLPSGSPALGSATHSLAERSSLTVITRTAAITTN